MISFMLAKINIFFHFLSSFGHFYDHFYISVYLGSIWKSIYRCVHRRWKRKRGQRSSLLLGGACHAALAIFNQDDLKNMADSFCYVYVLFLSLYLSLSLTWFYSEYQDCCRAVWSCWSPLWRRYQSQTGWRKAGGSCIRDVIELFYLRKFSFVHLLCDEPTDHFDILFKN